MNEKMLYKYKPLLFKDFTINREIIPLLTLLLKTHNFNILIIGDGCSGKTTWLESIIREYYSTNTYNDYQYNIIDITQMKEQGVNYYRNNIKEFCKVCSSIKHKKKIIIIDDIDQICDQNQQIFRGYIDKYSNNVNFIASCSNINKINEGIQSRLITININKFTTDELSSLYDTIILNERIKINGNELKHVIINICDNNSKILLNYMEKFKLLDIQVTNEIIHDTCMNINYNYYIEYTQFILNKDLKSAVLLFYSIYDKGYSVIDVLCNYFIFLKKTDLFDDYKINKFEITKYISKYISLFNTLHEDEIELSLFTNNIIQYITEQNI
jgi:DNA polymerase III delta prime subunit